MIVHRTTSRKNGLQPPFNRYQIIGWVLFVLELASTILCFIPPLEAAIRVFILSAFLCFTLSPGHLRSRLGPLALFVANLCFFEQFC